MSGAPRVALLGLGDIGLTQHLPALLRSSRLELDCVADISEQTRRRAAEVIGDRATKVLTSPDEVFQRPIDAVVLATPPWVTPDLANHALRRGLFVLAEKPFAVDLAAGEAIAVGLQPWASKYQLGLTYRHDPAIARLRDAIAQGELGGGPLLIHASIYDEALRPDDQAHLARILTTLGHGNPAVHEGAHVFDWLAAVLGDTRPVVADAWALTTYPSAPAPNMVGARLRYANGTIANVEFGWLLEALPPGFVRVSGSRGSAELGLDEFDLTIRTRDSVELFASEGGRMERCFDRQIYSFVDLIEGRLVHPTVGIEEGIATLRVADAIAEKLQS